MRGPRGIAIGVMVVGLGLLCVQWVPAGPLGGYAVVLDKTAGLPPNYVPALMRGSRVKGPLLCWMLAEG